MVITDAAVVLLIVIICRLSNHWTATNISNAHFMVGIIAVGLGFLSSAGQWAMRSRFDFQYAQSAGDMNLAKRTTALIEDAY